MPRRRAKQIERYQSEIIYRTRKEAIEAARQAAMRRAAFKAGYDDAELEVMRHEAEELLLVYQAVPKRPAEPPRSAERLLSLIISPARLEETLGDFEERFVFLAKRDGLHHARRWYWWHVLAIVVRGGLKAVLQAAKIWFGPA